MARLSVPVRDANGVVYVEARDGRVADQLELHRRVIEARLRDVLGAKGRAFVIVAVSLVSRLKRTICQMGNCAL